MVLRGWTQKLLRWPILIVVFTILGVEFLFYLFIRLLVNIYELSSRFRFRRQKAALREAQDFPSWCQAARELDRLEGRDEWKKVDESPYYDYQLIRQHMTNLVKLRQDRNFEGLMSLLKLIFTTINVGGINNHQLYHETHFGTKVLVHDFIQTILESSIVVRDAPELSLQQRRDFFRRARRWYGRTALLLSGGAAMGYYHTGVLKTLIEAKCLPQIISGASAGSLMASFIAVRTDAEVLRDLCVPEGEKFFRACEEPFCVKASRWLRTGYCFEKEEWIRHMRNGITKGDTTFLEAYQQYGRIINIAVTATSKYAPTLILNYRSTPDVVIWSAVLASSAFPNFMEPIELQLKNPKTGKLEGFHVHGQTFTDGTIKNDIPIRELTKLWNCNYYIVSQVNPHLVPFFYGQRGGAGQPASSLTKVQSSGLRGGFVLAMFEKLLKLEIKKWFKLIADLDLLPLIFGTDWRFIYLQKLTGTVTIVPDAPLWAYFRVISDPNYERMKHYIHTGEKATWYKLCRISNHYRLEKMLTECSRYLDAEAKKAGLPVAREKFSHVNAGQTESAQNGFTPSPPGAQPQRPLHSSLLPPKSHSTKKKHVNFTTQDSSEEEQRERQSAFFHLQPRLSPTGSPFSEPSPSDPDPSPTPTSSSSTSSSASSSQLSRDRLRRTSSGENSDTLDPPTRDSDRDLDHPFAPEEEGFVPGSHSDEVDPDPNLVPGVNGTEGDGEDEPFSTETANLLTHDSVWLRGEPDTDITDEDEDRDRGGQ